MGIIPISGNSRGAKLVIIETIFIFLDILAVAGRLWSRRIQRKSLEFNDWSIIVALVIMIARYGNEISSTGNSFHSETLFLTRWIVVIITGFGLHATGIAVEYGSEKITQFGMVRWTTSLLRKSMRLIKDIVVVCR